MDLSVHPPFSVHSERILKLATNISRDKLTSVGTCFGKFTKTNKFRLHITALDFLAPYAKVTMRFYHCYLFATFAQQQIIVKLCDLLMVWKNLDQWKISYIDRFACGGLRQDDTDAIVVPLARFFSQLCMNTHFCRYTTVWWVTQCSATCLWLSAYIFDWMLFWLNWVRCYYCT